MTRTTTSRPLDPATWHRRQFLRGLCVGTGALATAPNWAAPNWAAPNWAAPNWAAPNWAGAADSTPKPQPTRRVLFVWLAGGASQFETWDPKPSRETGGPFRSIPTSVPGYHVCELMPRLSQLMDKIAVVRSLNTEISAHAPAADLISTGRPPEAALEYPEIGVVLAKELAAEQSDLPGYVSFFLSTEGRRRPATGFLGGHYAPMLLENSMRPADIDLPEGISPDAHREREALRAILSRDFARQRAGEQMVGAYNSAFAKVRGLMNADTLFDLEQEPQAVRERYGPTEFGRQCLAARRLLEAGVPVVKVARGFWDSHHDNFESHRELVPDFDHVMSTLLTDLDERGLLDSTLVIMLSEFGRTPTINKDVGRDHYAKAWSCAFAGCGIRGGTVHGQTDEDGKAVVDGEVNAGDLAATIYKAVGIDVHKEYYAGVRPVPIVKEDAAPIDSILS